MSTNKAVSQQALCKAVSQQALCKAVSYKNPHLSVNTYFLDNDIIENDIIENDIIENRDSNTYKFKTYINGIVEIQNLQDFIIRLSVITSLCVIGCPRLFTNLYFLYENNVDKDNTVSIYLTVSISEQILLTIATSYLIMTEDLDSIYYTRCERSVIPKLILIGKIETYWSKYYSLLGIALVTKFYFANGHINAVHVYILLFAIFRLWIVQFFRLFKTTPANWNII